MRLSFISFLFIFVSLLSCKQEQASSIPQLVDEKESEIKLELLTPSQTGINFNNQINDRGQMNVFVWNFLYTGAGVAAGDINNDGLPDLYFAGNQVPDRLYLNKGNFQFEDITEEAGIIADRWTTGVTMADINGDGYLDIYVCKYLPTPQMELNRNRLFINQGDGTFKEEAASFGLNDPGFSVIAQFWDIDWDGDLDMYLVNQPFDQFSKLIYQPDQIANYPYTDRLFVQENGKFLDKTKELGLENERYGLNASIGDFDRDGWTDIYVCNDYHHADHLYINKGGVLNDEVKERTGHISFYSMGSDVADLNNDGLLDIMVLDMAFESHYRSKTNMESMQPERFWELVAQGQHYPYAQNTLQMNLGQGYFSEEAQLAGLSKTDWSAAPLFTDLDRDSRQDLLVTNGILKDMKNNDFNQFVSNRYGGRVGPSNYLEVLDQMPSNAVRNILYSNGGYPEFKKEQDSGFDLMGFSHGMAIADLDGDGLSDVVVNNMNAPASIYRNKGGKKAQSVRISLIGMGQNTSCLGCSVDWINGDSRGTQCIQTTRGFLSSSEPIIEIGTGEKEVLDSLIVHWNQREMSILTNLKSGESLKIDYRKEAKQVRRDLFANREELKEAPVLSFHHKETPFDDYKDQVLLPYKLSQEGPSISSGDLNGDGLEDIFIGGAAGQPGQIFIGNENGDWETLVQPLLLENKGGEDQGSVMIDTDDDGDLDLVVVSGSNEFEPDHIALTDRVYFNNGKGVFTDFAEIGGSERRINSSAVVSADFDGDGKADLFIAGRLSSGEYPLPAQSGIFFNRDGRLVNQTKSKAPFLSDFGLVTDAVSSDVDNDGDIDLLVVGEWMMPTLLLNDGSGKFDPDELDKAGVGIWWSIEKIDIEGDGDDDFLMGNLGWNNKFGGRKEPKLEVYAGDLDGNGDHDIVLAKRNEQGILPVRGRECSSEEMPFILNKFQSFDAFGRASLDQILSETVLDEAYHQKIDRFESIVLVNDGSGNFELSILPPNIQTAPIRAFVSTDYNQDGHMDFLVAGNHYPVEVETARYDALALSVCLGDSRNNFRCKPIFSDNKLIRGDVRDLRIVEDGAQNKVLIIAFNDGPVKTYYLP